MHEGCGYLLTCACTVLCVYVLQAAESPRLSDSKAAVFGLTEAFKVLYSQAIIQKEMYQYTCISNRLLMLVQTLS